jgi:hypothetical protein
MDGSVGFMPYDLKELLKELKKHKIGSELGSLDHHLDEMLGVEG